MSKNFTEQELTDEDRLKYYDNQILELNSKMREELRNSFSYDLAVLNNKEKKYKEEIEQIELERNLLLDRMRLKIESPAKSTRKWYAKWELWALIIAIISIPWWSNIFSIFSNRNIVQTESAEVKPQVKLENKKLRSLQALETGKNIGELPNDVYFFASAFEIVSELESPSRDFIRAKSTYSDTYDFEVQKVDNRYFLVGFVSDETYSKIGSVNSQNSLYTMLFPQKWEGAKQAVAIPFDQVYTVRDRTINFDERKRVVILDIGIKEIQSNIQSHIEATKP